MTNLLKTLGIIMLVLMSTGCAFAPKTAVDQPYANDCQMTTKMMALDKPREVKAMGCHRSNNGVDFLGCLILSGIIVPAGSLIISGSIVLINNSIHWLEYQGSCDKKQLEAKIEQLKQQNQTQPEQAPQQK